MTRQLSASAAKARLLALLDEVAAGEEIEITKRGHTVARPVPASGPRALKGRLAGVARTACVGGRAVLDRRGAGTPHDDGAPRQPRGAPVVGRARPAQPRGLRRHRGVGEKQAVSAISWYGSAWLAKHERIELSRPVRTWLEEIARDVRTVGITPAIVEGAVALPSAFPGDPEEF